MELTAKVLLAVTLSYIIVTEYRKRNYMPSIIILGALIIFQMYVTMGMLSIMLAIHTFSTDVTPLKESPPSESTLTLVKKGEDKNADENPIK
jgi:hypothetical protein